MIFFGVWPKEKHQLIVKLRKEALVAFVVFRKSVCHRIRKYLGHLSDPLPKPDLPSSNTTRLTHSRDKLRERHNGTSPLWLLGMSPVPTACLQYVPPKPPSFCLHSYGTGCPSEANDHVLPSPLQILKLSIPSSWNTALFLSKRLPASPSQECIRVSAAASPRWADVPSRGRLLTHVQLDALRSFRLSSCPLPLLHHSCALHTHSQGSPDVVECYNLAPRAEGRDAWLIASGLRDFKKTWASLRILESTKT